MSSTTRPYFIWDYNLTDEDVRRMVDSDNEVERTWAISRILESARYEDVWKYLTLRRLRQVFPELKLKKPIRRAWERALTVWDEADHGQ